MLAKIFGIVRPRAVRPRRFALVVSVDGEPIATIRREEDEYVLTYTEAFLRSGLPPFNASDLKKGELPVVGIEYRSEELWYPFAARMPSPNRDDYRRLLEKNGLSGREDPLVILGRVARYSISKPWDLVPQEA